MNRIIILSLLILLGACNKEWLDVNEDTNNVTENNVTPELVLPQALLKTSSIPVTAFEFLEKWMGYWSLPGGTFVNFMDQLYMNYSWLNVLSDQTYAEYMRNNNNYQFVIDKSHQQGMFFYEGISRIMKAHNFAILADLFNNIPYSQALKGAEIQQPVYDLAKDVYENLLSEIDTSIELIKNADVAKNAGIISADIIYHADKNKWIRFANSLKLRLLVHQSAAPGREAYIQQEINKIITEASGFMLAGETAAANPGFLKESTKTNPYYERYGFDFNDNPSYYSTQVRANSIAMNFLKENNDPRLGYFYKPVNLLVPPDAPEPFPQVAPFNYRANVYGFSINPGMYPYQGVMHTSAIGGRTSGGSAAGAPGLVKGYDMDMWLFTAFESLFLEAEAMQRGWLPGNAEEKYKQAIAESFNWLNVAPGEFDTWYINEENAANQNVSWAAAPDKLKLILFQKYLALNGNTPLEAWTDYRRNNKFPDIPLSAAPGRNGNPLPVRLLYPQEEYTYNAENVKKNGEIDLYTSKIWWMP